MSILDALSNLPYMFPWVSYMKRGVLDETEPPPTASNDPDRVHVASCRRVPRTGGFLLRGTVWLRGSRRMMQKRGSRRIGSLERPVWVKWSGENHRFGSWISWSSESRGYDIHVTMLVPVRVD